MQAHLNAAQLRIFTVGQLPLKTLRLYVMPQRLFFLFSPVLSPLWWKCDWIFRLHPLAQLPAPLSTQQRLRLAHFRPLGLCHFLGFHQVKELHQCS